jgi:hypothetical protein
MHQEIEIKLWECLPVFDYLVQNLLSSSLLSKRIRLKYRHIYFACCFIWV